ncbi:hypothetical protein ASPACDRAFT_113535 [Aspergillus aculeatus ATCC 16872]|uniref:HTH araC/xylS-type domain-containing protein n=1 Tax=Aspergillus aculeatus (strain ATCC 16872 / CBS 172.66 / WB 5094) TaxID=690307 RepID=A0A1L9X3F5_ASPA1|nr:uncharacterized protein ASPACDRAFT_113535 [Aspergillus aculeatus ATCC 16872]OJK02976.1 hypothetical protein ASPACDRAFT_113535 [Aspergillus aculeatus ATCC 16872]
MTPMQPTTLNTSDRPDHSSSFQSSNSSSFSSSSHARWLALTHRAPSSHSAFIYGVKSTKIYCRPTCAARLARRANVEFFDTVEQARAAGFRPCKRCQPDCASFVGEREGLVSRVIALLRVHPGGFSSPTPSSSSGAPEMKLRLKDLAQEAGVTPSYLCRVFKRTMGITIGTYMAEFEKEGCDAEVEGEGEGEGEGVAEMAVALPAVRSDQINVGAEPAVSTMIQEGGLKEMGGRGGGGGGGKGGGGGATLSPPTECPWNVLPEENLHGVDPTLPTFDLEEWFSSAAFLNSNLFLDDSVLA